MSRLQLALQAAGKVLHDKAATHHLGRCRDIPLSLAPCIRDGSDTLLGHGPLSAEFQHLRRDFAPFEVHFLGDISTADGKCLLLPRQLRHRATHHVPRCFQWLRKHATSGAPAYAWHPALSVGPSLPEDLPLHLQRLTLSEARQFFQPVLQANTTSVRMDPPPPGPTGAIHPTRPLVGHL